MRRFTVFLANTIGMALLNIRANRQVFFVSVGSIAIAFAIFCLFLLVFANLQHFFNSWNSQVELVAYLDDGVTEKERTEIESLMKNNATNGGEVYFVSKDEAWQDFKQIFSQESSFMGTLDFNPLPASYHLRFGPQFDRLENIQALANQLRQKNGVESVEYGQEWIDGFEQFLFLARMFLWCIGVSLCIGLMLIVSNTIKLSFYTRQGEIELMRLIGATDGFVKGPFFLEGVLAGLLGALGALLSLKLVHFYLTQKWGDALEVFAGGIAFLSFKHSLMVILTGIVIGGLGSRFSVHALFKRDTRA